MKYTLLGSALVASVSAVTRSAPPPGAVTVCPSGCDYSTIQKAVTATKTGSIFIYKGTYNEQVKIPSSIKNLAIYGETTDTSSHTNNVVSLEHKLSQAMGASNNEATATLDNQGSNVSIYNIDIKNTAGKGSQAVALMAYNKGHQGYYGVGLYGYQDTFLTWEGVQIFAHGYIEGAIDFIFGREGSLWITNSTLAVAGPGYITASGRTSADSPAYYVINDSTVTKAAGASISGDVYLGRPWGEYARVAFQHTSLPSFINSAGWKAWDDKSETGNVVYGEFENTGAGVSSKRKFETKLSRALDIGDILGSDYTSWVDAAYI